MVKLFLQYIMLLFAVICFSCKKDEAVIEEDVVCTDVHSPYYSNKGIADNATCKYMYVTEYEITNFPPKNGSGNWDPIAVGNFVNPDLIFYFGKETAQNWSFISTVIDNTTPAGINKWTAPIQLMLTNEEWKWNLEDDDSPLSSNEIIASGTFNPLKQSRQNGKFVVQTNLVTITFYYDIR
jgi:hypothetical protein